MTFIVLNRGILPVMRRCGVKGEHYGRLIDGTVRLRPLSGETTNVRSAGVKSKLAGRVRSSFKSPPLHPSPFPFHCGAIRSWFVSYSQHLSFCRPWSFVSPDDDVSNLKINEEWRKTFSS